MSLRLRSQQSTQNHLQDLELDNDVAHTGSPPARDRNVLVSCGIHHRHYPIRGLTVQAARTTLGEIINIEPSAVAVINGRIVDEETVIDDQTSMVSFVKPSSLKG